MAESIEFLERLNFERIEKIEALKISKGQVEFYTKSDLDFDKASKIISPDLRYYWDGERFGLHVSDSEIDIFSDFINNLKNEKLNDKIEVLYIGRTLLTKFNLFENSLKSLKYIYFYDNPELLEISLYEFSSIIEFGCTNCQKLERLEFIGEYKELKKLDICNCKINELEVNDWESLEFLKIDNNEIRSIIISNSQNLQYVFASNNKIQNFQIECITPKLNIVDISYNPELKVLSLKENLNELESINLNDTRIDLEGIKFLTDCVSLKEVRLENTPVQQSYPEEVEQGWEFLKLLFKDSQAAFYHQKILLLGNPNIGKTNLLYWWQNKEHPKNKIDKESTHGVKYSVINDIIKTPDGQNINLHFWDFGGQDYFHATHQLFFSKGSINLLIWAKENLQRDGSDDNFYNIDYWLRCIQQLSQDPENAISTDTIIVQNKFDLLETNKPALINQIDIEKAPYALNLNLFFTNVLINPDGNGRLPPKYLNHLEEQISDIISSKNYNRPKSWVDKYDEIISYETPVIDLNNLKGDINENKSIAQYFHDRGLILYFETCCKDKIFTKPQVFLNFLYIELFDNVNEYKLSVKKIKSQLEKSVFKNQINETELIAILKHFNLVFEIPEFPNTFFIPQYLPKKNEWIAFFESYQFSEPEIIIKSDYFLMNQAMLLIFKLFGRFTKKGDEKNLLFWQDGIIIELESKLIQIRLNRKTQSLEIFFGRDKIEAELIEVIVAIITNPTNSEEIYKLFKEFSDAPKEKIVFAVLAILYTLYSKNKVEKDSNSETSILQYWNTDNFDIFINNGKNKFVSFAELKSNSLNSLPFINLYQKTDDVYELLKTDETTSIYGFNQYLDGKQKGARKKLMISYSKDDLKLVTEFTAHLEPLIRNGDLETWWYCTDLEAGQAWKDEIEPRLKTFDIVCFMVSSSFYNTKYIRDLEIKIVMDRYRNEEIKPMIVPIILEPYHWTSDSGDYNLGEFTGLPYTARPVSSFSNRQEAWHIIGECLRLAIRNKEHSLKDDYWLEKDKEKLPKDVRLFFEKIINENKNG